MISTQPEFAAKGLARLSVIISKSNLNRP